MQTYNYAKGNIALKGDMEASSGDQLIAYLLDDYKTILWIDFQLKVYKKYMLIIPFLKTGNMVIIS
ncbi:hypothetical protein WICANDRAFT_91517 [Wickerhamomyces anomalus NRRL Y-366-8]|uniref:Uncharacterized protein n=1 Tax=Wickerhamomyces anomalus (strain ATCC 58044 / CBS 1984 / NCYC 433 / NRRL Y-366-8) TaxID=683960 RepID=A0A1E3P2I8_WICAA|nr:uncharacterized protein WICANDRAFT_91517 [Wickerhamomyces anomalus NRRL Y-366-8]ODQ59696.1 hypothetical protein WICANDRAFT_91517 [Wickerhamomyces anomalus NRRL Y-366-8]